MDQAAPSWSTRLWRWRWLILLVIIVVAVRAALPVALRYVLVSQGSQILQSRIDVGNVDLWLLQGAVAIDDFSLRPAVGPTPGAGTAAPTEPSASNDAPANAAPADDDRPLISWKRLLVDIQWLPLWSKIARLSDITLEAPRIAVARLASGHFSYEPVVRAALEYAAGPTPTGAAGEPTAAPTAVPESSGPGWQVGLDHVVIREGSVRFHDRMLKDSEPLDIGIPTVDVKDIALSPALYGDKSHAQLHLGIDEGGLDIDARVALLDKGFWLETNIDAQNLPLRRSRLYVPGVGWSELLGEVDLSLWYGLETGVRDNLKGTVTLRDVSITVPGLTDSALAWKSFKMRIDDLDLRGHAAKIGAVDLTGAVVTIRLYGDDRFPLLQRAMAAEEPSPSPSPAEAPAEPSNEAAEPPPPAAPWQWSVGTVQITDSKVHGLTTETPLDVAIALTMKSLASAPDTTASVDLALTSEVGNVNVKGDARIAPPGFGGLLKVDGLSLPRVAALSGAVAPELVQSGTFQAELTVAAGMAASGSSLAPAARDVLVQGKLGFADTRLALSGNHGAAVSLKNLDLGIGQLAVQSAFPAADPAAASGLGLISFRGTLGLGNPLVALADGKEFSLAAKSFDLGINELSVPPPVDASSAGLAKPIRVALGKFRLDTPVIRVTRIPEGIVLPSFSVTAPAAAAPEAPASAETPAAVAQAAPTQTPPAAPEESPAPPPTSAAPDAAAPAAPVDVAVDTLQLTSGRLDIADRTVKPPFNGKLSPINLSARDLRWPALAVNQLRLAVTTPTQGVFEITGDLSPKGGVLNIDGKEVSLMPYNSYASTYSPYRVSQGSFSMSTKVTIEGGRYDAKNELTLHEFNVEGGGSGESAFEKEFGIPVSMALALMRDTKGDIGLEIPVQVNPEGTQIDLLAIAGGALRRALMGALASPLKMFGALAGGSASSIVPAAIDLRPGRATFAPGGAERAEQLGALLKGRPALAVEIDAVPSAADVRWLQEQALLKQWDEQGVFGAIGGLMQRGTRDRVREALAAHGKDENAELSADDYAALETWLAALPPITAQQLQGLEDQRMGILEAALRDQSGIDAARIRRGEPSTEVTDAPPVLRIQLQPATASSKEGEDSKQE